MTVSTRSAAPRRRDRAAQALFLQPMSTIADAQTAAVRACFDMNRTFLNNWAEAQREAAAFLGNRFSENASRARRIAGGAAQDDALAVQSEFARKMASDYSDGVNRMLGFALEIGTACSRFGAEIVHAAEEAGEAARCGAKSD